jgi:hypothetical protein
MNRNIVFGEDGNLLHSLLVATVALFVVELFTKNAHEFFYRLGSVFSWPIAIAAGPPKFASITNNKSKAVINVIRSSHPSRLGSGVACGPMIAPVEMRKFFVELDGVGYQIPR